MTKIKEDDIISTQMILGGIQRRISLLPMNERRSYIRESKLRCSAKYNQR